MANILYPKGRNKFARGDIHWLSGGDTIRVCLVKDDYTYSDTHEFFSDLSGYAVGNNGLNTRTDCPALTLGDPVDGVCDANDVTLNNVPVSTDICNYVVIFKDTGADGTSPLLVRIDTSTGTTLPITPNNNNVVITWDNGASKIFKL